MSGMIIPPPLLAAMQAVRQSGGRPRLVGGCVRDYLLGITPKDYDVEVGYMQFEDLHRVLAPFGPTDVVGKSFGVIKVRLEGIEYDFSLPRRESKTGAGHRGFYVKPEPDLSDALAAARRDFTINSIAFDPFRNTLIDPHNGADDLKARILRHTSEAFSEDPLRVLRAMQFAARFDLNLAPETASLCQEIADSYYELPLERIWGEWDKWATQAHTPSRGLSVLVETGWIKHFPEIAALRGTPQEPEWHPEGDVFRHTQCCLDALTGLQAWQDSAPERRRLLSFAVLAHDFGKPCTTSYAEKRGAMRWVSPGHEAAGGPLSETFMQRIGSPKDLIEPVRTLVVHHLLHHHQDRSSYSDSQLRRLARRLVPATVDDLCEVMTSDAMGRPPMNPASSLRLIAELRAQATLLHLRTEPPKPILLGRHLLALDQVAGPGMKPILDAGFEAQLDGVFMDEEGAIDWAKHHLAKAPRPPQERSR